MALIVGKRIENSVAAKEWVMVPNAAVQLYVHREGGQMLWVHHGHGYCCHLPREEMPAFTEITWRDIVQSYVLDVLPHASLRVIIVKESDAMFICDLWAQDPSIRTPEYPFRRLRLELAALDPPFEKGAPKFVFSCRPLDLPTPAPAQPSPCLPFLVLTPKVVLQVNEYLDQILVGDVPEDGPVPAPTTMAHLDKNTADLLRCWNFELAFVTALVNPHLDHNGNLQRTRFMVCDLEGIDPGANRAHTLAVCSYDHSAHTITKDAEYYSETRLVGAHLFPQGVLLFGGRRAIWDVDGKSPRWVIADAMTPDEDGFSVVRLPLNVGAKQTFWDPTTGSIDFVRSGKFARNRIVGVLPSLINYCPETHLQFPLRIRMLVLSLLMAWRVRRPGSPLGTLVLPMWTWQTMLWFILANAPGMTRVFGQNVF
jgi:hypothetical protein